MPTAPKVPKRPYLPPQWRGLNFEQASLSLVWHAWNGDQNARDLLEVMFPLPGEKPSE